VDFTGLAPTGESKDDYGSGPGYHLLNPRPGATVLLRVAGHPLLVSGKYGKGLTFAYLGFSPAGSGKVKDRQPVIVDRAIRSSSEGRLFTIISASLLALASGQDPRVGISDIVETRAAPLFETLKDAPQAAWPRVLLTWTHLPEGRVGARVHIQNGPRYVRGLRLRFEGPDFREGSALALWSNQFFDLLPGEEADCTVELVTASNSPLLKVTLEAETLYGAESKNYPIPLPPQ
jgi:hypothetical protein